MGARVNAHSLFLSTVTLDPVSALIRAETRCAWSHAGLRRKSDGYTLAAMNDGGVKWRPPNLHEEMIEFDVDGVDAVVPICETQIGDKYDYLDIVGIMTGRNWFTTGRMICDKLLLWAFQQYGQPIGQHALHPYRAHDASGHFALR
jgi:hypothetical protein